MVRASSRTVTLNCSSVSSLRRRPLASVAGDVSLGEIAFAEPLAVQDQHFIDCMINGSQPSVDGTSGLAVVQALECAQISLQEQRPVALAEVMQRHGAGSIRTGLAAAQDTH